ncbi:hypothetical protein KTR66_03595 [Roseococcus sp. SDR]|uniref:hypothetical protein n=1 Tax=Roseococcus sp. SDR TaxID=2835532 RepID=UPI001BCFD4B2|nr:hypothetical protein [Roseococcus sp. SDR]MBS7789063.1 hypothetical protein [Roseococcus sp. SDR]MBV1844377.1 hypothetical protein [Roseococcus sp. SDR]
MTPSKSPLARRLLTGVAALSALAACTQDPAPTTTAARPAPAPAVAAAAPAAPAATTSAQRAPAPGASATSRQACLQPAEKTAFDIRALQSQLLVAALACGQHDNYNAFVRKNQAELGTAFRTLGTYFRRTEGAQGQRQLDQYITELANSQSRISIDRGSFFCNEQGPLFQAAMAANSPNELAQVSVTRQVHQALSAPVCPAPAPRQTPQRSTPAR